MHDGNTPSYEYLIRYENLPIGQYGLSLINLSNSGIDLSRFVDIGFVKYTSNFPMDKIMIS